MIQLNNLCVKIGDRFILDHIQFDFQESFIHGIVGLNGAGKTTFFNAISGIQKPSLGNITYGGKAISHSDIGYLEANNFFFSRITGNEFLNIFSKTNTEFDIQALNQLMRLPLDTLIETYSSGMKKKLALLSIIKQNKPIYLLDEPFNSLDLESSQILELAIVALKEKGKTVFVSSHIIETLTPICDFIHLIENGVLKRTFTKAEFDNVEEELLGHLKDSAKKILNQSM